MVSMFNLNRWYYHQLEKGRVSMRTRNEMKEELSLQTFDELHRYKDILIKNQKMGVTHLESMEVNDLQLEITDELIREQLNPNWTYNS